MVLLLDGKTNFDSNADVSQKLHLFESFVNTSFRSGSSGLDLRSSLKRCVVFLGKTLNSPSASLHPGV